MVDTVKKEIKIKTEFIRLDQLLKWAGIVGSGVEAKFMIEAGNVLVNEEIELRRGRKVFNNDSVQINASEPIMLHIVCEGTLN